MQYVRNEAIERQKKGERREQVHTCGYIVKQVVDENKNSVLYNLLFVG